ncbi:MAG: lipopolysaccharide biosynthesis protein [Geminicoccaceae bacterium]|nr:lipopolysaccharide biosynthesis protein [Geminicoccaceae bacterium]
MDTEQRRRAENVTITGGAAVARSAIWRILEVSGAEFLSFLFMIVLARLLSPSDYGLVAIASVIILGLQMLVYHGFAENIIQRNDLQDDHLNAAFWANVGLSFCLALVCVLVAWPVALMTDKPGFAPVMLALAPTMISFGVVGIYQAVMRRELAFKGLAIRSLASIGAGGMAGVLAALAGWGPWSLVTQQLCYAAMNMAVILGFSRWQPSFRFPLAHLRSMVGAAWRIAATWLLETFSRNGAILILGIFLQTSQVGLFFVAYRVFMALSNLTFWSVGEISLPVLSRLQGERETEIRASLQTLDMTALVSLASFWGLAAVADPLIMLLFGETWRGSVMPLQILAAIGILNGMTSTTSQILTSFGHPGSSLKIQMLIALLLASFVTITAPFGLISASLGIAAAFIVATPFALWLLRKDIGVDLTTLARHQAPVWLAAALMTAAVIVLRSSLPANLPAILHLACEIPVGISVFTGTLWCLRPSLLRTVTEALVAATRRR